MRTPWIASVLFASIAAVPLIAQTVPGRLTPEQEQARAACVGLTVQEYRDWSDPTHSENRQLTKQEQARQTALGQKVNKVPRDQQTECNRQASMAEMSSIMGGMRQHMDAVEQRSGSNSSGTTEAPGKTAHLSADVASDLAAGRTVVRDVDWVAGKADVSAAGTDAFHSVTQALTPALISAGGKFTVDFFLDPRYDDQSANYVADPRMKTLRDALPGVHLDKGKVVRDADTRLEFVKAP